MTYEELKNINSDNPDPNLLYKFIQECDGIILSYHNMYKDTKNRHWLGKMAKHGKWRKLATNKLKNII